MTFLKGLIIGATMVVPGVSGGSMAMILGIYDRLISAISSFQKRPKENIIFLGLFILGAGTGFFCFAAPIGWLLEHYRMITLYFFMGAVFGGIPMIQKKSRTQQMSWDVTLYMLAGAASVALISRIPNLGVTGNESCQMLIQIVAGMISAVALVLPGISVSHFLLVLGIYEEILQSVKSLDVVYLLPLGIGGIAGIILFTKLLEYAMNRHPKQAYLTILGFILGSVAQIFPGISLDGSIILCLLMAGLGFAAVYRLSRNE